METTIIRYGFVGAVINMRGNATLLCPGLNMQPYDKIEIISFFIQQQNKEKYRTNININMILCKPSCSNGA